MAGVLYVALEFAILLWSNDDLPAAVHILLSAVCQFTLEAYDETEVAARAVEAEAQPIYKCIKGSDVKSIPSGPVKRNDLKWSDSYCITYPMWQSP